MSTTIFAFWSVNHAYEPYHFSDHMTGTCTHVVLAHRTKKAHITLNIASLVHIAALWRTPLPCAWPAGIALNPWSGEIVSEINITRILSGAEESVCQVSPLIFRLHFCAIIRCIRLDWSTTVCVVGAMQPVMLPGLARAWRHVVWLISNVLKNSNMRPLYPDTMSLQGWVNRSQWANCGSHPDFVWLLAKIWQVQ